MRWYSFEHGRLMDGTWHDGQEFTGFTEAMSWLSILGHRDRYFVLIGPSNRLQSKIIPPCFPLPPAEEWDDLRSELDPRCSGDDFYMHDQHIEYYQSWSPPGSPRYFVCNSQGTPRSNAYQLQYTRGYATPELIFGTLADRGYVWSMPSKIVAVLDLPHHFDPRDTGALLRSPDYAKVDVTGLFDSAVFSYSSSQLADLLLPAYHDLVSLNPVLNPRQDNAIMPPTSTPSAPLEHTPDSLCRLAIRRDPSNSRLTLIVDAKPLHDLLDKMGVQVESGSEMYANRPAARFGVASGDFALSTEVLLRRRYPAEFNLSQVWTTPPTIKQLRTLGESAHNAIRKVLEHYRPIDISFSIIKSAGAV